MTANQFHNDINLGIVNDEFSVGGEHSRRQVNSTVPRQLSDDDAFDLDGNAQTMANQIGIFLKNLHNAGADSPQSDDADSDLLLHCRSSNRWIAHAACVRTTSSSCAR